MSWASSVRAATGRWAWRPAPWSPAVGFALVQIWLALVGVLGILFTVGGLLFEYYLGGRHPVP